MTITTKQLQRMIKNPKLLVPMTEDSGIDPRKLVQFNKLSDEDLEGLRINAEYWMRNYATFEISYASQYEYEPTPIYIYGIRGLYLVLVSGERGLFFDTKKDAIAYANEAIKIFFVDNE
jgi:hypothetical protein